ncbi:MAG: GIY-YIG nuclease family protein [Spirochaetia bacterium]|jgi:hypothetical protein|nr:GIY-YIG nuclease family protein [Spirochaetia bacterium]
MKTNIYFIRKDNEIKIGRSVDIERRIEGLQVANSVNLKLLYKIVDVDEKFEQHIHSICGSYHIRGEWFSEGVIEFLLSHPFYKEHMKEAYSISNS